MISGKYNIFSTSRKISEAFKAVCTNKHSGSHLFSGRAFYSISKAHSNRSRFYKTAFLSLFSRMASSSKESSKFKRKNRLALEKSPYLLQHAENPVQWYPWGNEAFELAQKEQKLIFLSVGYSTCHWCHVMEKESFENEEIAKIMNDYYVNIKVDKEERPDVNDIYMAFIVKINKHGGWPLSVFLTPDLQPITGGTYFPPEGTPMLPGFKTILLNIAKNWQQSGKQISLPRSKLLNSIMESLSDNHNTEGSLPSIRCPVLCVRHLSLSFDKIYGGFSMQPKFPQPINFSFLFNVYAHTINEDLSNDCLTMSLHSLTMISRGGIHDHIGQGFARYSVDERWHVPHFEKMLYDQGQLIQSYTDGYIASKDEYYAEIVDDIVTYISRDLRHPEGGFYSAEDADSYPTHDSESKVEGAFYVWDYEELKELLNKPIHSNKDITLLDIICYHYNAKEEGNVHESQDPHGELMGKNVFIEKGSVENTADHFNCSIEDMKLYFKEAKQILFNARLKRPRPHLDDKIVTAWNGLTISGLSRAGAVLGNKQYIQLATDAAKFIERYAFDKLKNRLVRCCYRGENNVILQASVPIYGFLTDYASLITGLLDLYEASFDDHWLELAEVLQDIQDELFWDSENYGYFSTTSDDPTIILRLKQKVDGVEPSGNSLACNNLLRLAAFLDRYDLKDKAEKIFRADHILLKKVPTSVPLLMSALINYYYSMTQIFVVGKRDSNDTEEMLEVINKRLIPHKILMFVDPEEKQTILFRKNHVVTNLKMIKDRTTAYVCQHHTCSLPVNSPEDLASLLDNKCKENLSQELQDF